MSKPRSYAGVAKISVSLAPDNDLWLRDRAAKTGRAYSTVLGEAVAEARELEARRALLGWLEKGQARPITAADLDAVRAEWRGGRRRRSA
jgi:hypothetical protein